MTIKRFDKPLLRNLCQQANHSPRKRAHHLIHADHADGVQRLLIAFQPGTYIQPHRHTTPPIWESHICLSGSALILCFDDDGRVTDKAELSATGPLSSIELDPGVWHGLVALEADTVTFEFKQGPFQSVADDGFAAWAPQEGDSHCDAVNRWMSSATIGESWQA